MADKKQLLNEAELENITGGSGSKQTEFKCSNCKKEFYAYDNAVAVCPSCGGLAVLIESYNYLYPNG